MNSPPAPINVIQAGLSITTAYRRDVVLFTVKPYLLPDQAGKALHVREQGVLVDVHLKEPLFDLRSCASVNIEGLAPVGAPRHHFVQRLVKAKTRFEVKQEHSLLAREARVESRG